MSPNAHGSAANLEPRVPNPESRTPNRESRTASESRIPIPESRVPNPDSLRRGRELDRDFSIEVDLQPGGGPHDRHDLFLRLRGAQARYQRFVFEDLVEIDFEQRHPLRVRIGAARADESARWLHRE